MPNVLTDTVQRTIDGMQPRHVFAEPIERDGAIFLPAASVRGGGGGGGDTEGNGGAGFGLTAKPAGVFVIRDGDAVWRPALDVNRMILGAQVVAVVVFLVMWRLLRRG